MAARQERRTVGLVRSRRGDRQHAARWPSRWCSATADYPFCDDAAAGVVTDWMYEALAKTYTLDEENHAFLRHANPWALRGIIERLKEAADRGLCAEPDAAVMVS